MKISRISFHLFSGDAKQNNDFCMVLQTNFFCEFFLTIVNLLIAYVTSYFVQVDIYDIGLMKIMNQMENEIFNCLPRKTYSRKTCSRGIGIKLLDVDSPSKNWCLCLYFGLKTFVSRRQGNRNTSR